MKKLFFLLLFPLLLFGNMAKPWMDGSQHSTLYGVGNASVKSEVIDIRLVKEPVDEIYFADYTIKYRVYSPQKQTLPLLFIAINLYDNTEVKVNGVSKKIELIDIEKKKYPFIQQNETGFFVQYSHSDKVSVDPNSLLYFSADLMEGENIIEVKYEANLEYNTYGFIKDYKLKYSLYPSKFWKSFGPIDINLILDNGVEFKDSNLGDEKKEKNILKWKIDPQNQENMTIEVSEKPSFISKILLFLNPFGIAILSLIAMSFIHFKLMKRNTKMYILVLGIVLVPILFYVIYLLSFDLINFSLGKRFTKHGYVFLYVVTYPILLLFYWILMLLIFRRIKRNQNPASS
ncbi:hypothetical protein [Chryseobacterium sp. RLHN22]|uniref:hypothetical protein n=1 Tax=Chryseobacterium sp. RLHN22 TaxID=3437885 RepID=UPI003D9AF0ED